jgi:hypothetical protein
MTAEMTISTKAAILYPITGLVDFGWGPGLASSVFSGKVLFMVLFILCLMFVAKHKYTLQISAAEGRDPIR